jgi:hypothetical protein
MGEGEGERREWEGEDTFSENAKRYIQSSFFFILQKTYLIH